MQTVKKATKSPCAVCSAGACVSRVYLVSVFYLFIDVQGEAFAVDNLDADVDWLPVLVIGGTFDEHHVVAALHIEHVGLFARHMAQLDQLL